MATSMNPMVVSKKVNNDTQNCQDYISNFRVLQTLCILVRSPNKTGSELSFLYIFFVEVRCPKCDFLTQRDGWMCGKQNFKDIHPRAGLARVNDEFSRCQLRCGFQIKPIFDDD